MNWLRSQRLPEEVSEKIREEWRKLQGYIDNNLHRMNYPEYRRQGFDRDRPPAKRVSGGDQAEQSEVRPDIEKDEGTILGSDGIGDERAIAGDA